MISTLTLTSPKYPRLLREIPDPPEKLFVRGHGDKINLARTIAIVGARRNTSYGAEMTKRLVTDLVRSGFVISAP